MSARDSVGPGKARSKRSSAKRVHRMPTRLRGAGKSGVASSPESPPASAHPLTVLPALQEVTQRLTNLRSVVLTVSLALQVQRAEYNPDIAHTLKQSVSDELDRLLWRLRAVLGHEQAANSKERQS
jgi:hypothetical protein